MEKASLGFRDFFIYVTPGSIYLSSILVWHPEIFSDYSTLFSSIVFVLVSYLIGFSSYGLSYFVRHVLPGWQEENRNVTKKLIIVITNMADYYNHEIFRYRNLCRACLSLAPSTLLLGVSLSVKLWKDNNKISFIIAIFTFAIVASILYRAIRYNKRYLDQINIAYSIADKAQNGSDIMEDS